MVEDSRFFDFARNLISAAGTLPSECDLKSPIDTNTGFGARQLGDDLWQPSNIQFLNRVRARMVGEAGDTNDKSERENDSKIIFVVSQFTGAAL